MRFVGSGGGGGVTLGGFGSQPEAEGPSNQWESRFGMRVDVLAAFAYLLGPISGVQLLIYLDYCFAEAFHSANLSHS